MKKVMGLLIIGTLLTATGVFAADGDFLVNGKVGIGTANPTNKLTVAGVIESTTGGFKFPDGSTQITAAAGGLTPALRAYLGTGHVISGDRWITLKIDQVQENPGGGFDKSSHAYTVPENGWYSIFLRTTGSGCYYGLVPRILINNVLNVNGYGDSVGVGHFSATLYLEQNQSITFQVFHNNYDAQILGGSGNTFVHIRKLSH